MQRFGPLECRTASPRTRDVWPESSAMRPIYCQRAFSEVRYVALSVFSFYADSNVRAQLIAQTAQTGSGHRSKKRRAELGCAPNNQPLTVASHDNWHYHTNDKINKEGSPTPRKRD